MTIEALTPTTGAITPKNHQPASQVDDARDKQQSSPEDLAATSTEKKDIQSEELLNVIKGITDNGLYSLKFENNDNDDLIVKVIDRETDEVIREIPPEELQQLTKKLQKLQGNLVDTVG